MDENVEIVKWQDVVAISKGQSEENQKLCLYVLDFWQQREPSAFARIKNTGKYRNGDKIEFGIDLDADLEKYSENHPEIGNASHFDYLSNPQYVNIASKQCEVGVMLDRTGIARRYSFEDIVYHELSHAGDSINFEQREKTGIAVNVKKLYGEYKTLIEDCLKDETIGKDPELKSLLGNTHDKIKDTENFYRILASFYDLKDSLGDYQQSVPAELKQRFDTIISEGMKLKKDAPDDSVPGSNEHEERVTKETDQAMQSVDSDFVRGVYANATDISAGSFPEYVPVASKIVSYGNGTVEIAPEIDFSKILKRIKEGAITLKNITGKNDSDTIAVDWDSLHPVDEKLLRPAAVLNHLAGSGENGAWRIGGVSPSATMTNSGADKLKEDADTILKKDAQCEQPLENLTAAFKTGDKTKIREAKKAFAEAADNLLRSVTQVGEDLRASTSPDSVTMFKKEFLSTGR